MAEKLRRGAQSKTEVLLSDIWNKLATIGAGGSGATEAASGERTPLLLLDFNHLYFILGGMMTLPEVINRVKRHAAQTAEAYLAVKNFGK